MNLYYPTPCKYCTLYNAGRQNITLKSRQEAPRSLINQVPVKNNNWKLIANIIMCFLIRLCILICMTKNILQFSPFKWVTVVSSLSQKSLSAKCLLAKCLVAELSELSAKCPSAKFLSGKYLSAKCPVGESSVGELSVSEVSFGKSSVGEMC